MKKTIILSILLIIVSFAKICACSCFKFNVERSYKNADLIFTGKVIEINKTIIIDSIPIVNDENQFRIDSHNRIEFKFKILKLYKGELKTEFVSIFTTAGIADCGNYFPLNSEHLVYSYVQDFHLNDFEYTKKVEPYFSTNLCTRTNDLKKIKKREIKEIEKLSKIK